MGRVAAACRNEECLAALRVDGVHRRNQRTHGTRRRREESRLIVGDEEVGSRLEATTNRLHATLEQEGGGGDSGDGGDSGSGGGEDG